MKQPRYSILKFQAEFKDNDTCLEYLFRALYGKPKCPVCARVDGYYHRKGTSHYVCACGGHQISPKTGTIFHKSDTDLYKWFFAMYLMMASKNGVSAKELERELEVTYKTAWRIAKELRSLMAQFPGVFDGIVEADETYVGGIRRGTRGRGAEGKTPIVGVVKRKGSVHAKVVTDCKASTVMPLIRSNVAIGTELMTDKFASYRKARKMGYKHKTVDHGRKEYVRGKVHTNTIEGFWSQLKRSIDGTYHSVSPKHLQSYVDEFAWRYNLRASDAPLFPILLSQVGASKR